MARSGGGGGGGGGVLAALSVVVLGGLQQWHRAEMLRRAQLEESGEAAAAGAEASGLWTALALLAGLAVVLFGVYALYRALRVPRELWKDPDHPRDWLGFPVVAEAPPAAPSAAPPPPPSPEAQAPAAAPTAPGIGWPRALLSWVLGAGALLMLVAAVGLGYRHATSSPTPVAVDLAALEGGAPLPDPHVEIGKHLALEHWAVLRVPEGAPDGPAAPVSGALFPLVSGKHPFVQKLRRERLSREDLLTVPRARRSELGPVAFLSEPRTLATRGDRPARGRLRDQVRGVTYRRASQLSRADRALVREAFPGIDLERAWLLREGRPPPGLDAVLVSLALGLALGYLTRRARVAG